MDSLKTLMDKKEYELVLKLTENSQDVLALFYRLSALVATGQTNGALALIEQKKNILLSKPMILMKFHIEILCLLGKFDEAYEALAFYREQPYENQETEELLQSLPKYIREEEKKTYQRREVGQDEIREKLLSKNDDEVLSALDAVRNQPLDCFLLPILNILKTYPRQMVRAFALLLLMSKKYDKKVSFLHYDQLIDVIPSSLKEPFFVASVGGIEKVSILFQNAFHDPSLANNAINILSSYLIYIYPDEVSYTANQLVVIFGYLAKDFLRIRDNDLDKMCEEYGLNKEDTLQEIIKIKKHIENS